MAMGLFALAIFLFLNLDLDHGSPSSASAASSPGVEITYGTVLKLMHEKTKVRLHSHDVPYGSGSGQQSVTGFPNVDDSNSYWIFDWMETKNLNMFDKDHALRIDLIAKKSGIDEAENYFNNLPAKNHLIYGSLLNCYCYQGMTDKALALFEEMDKLHYVQNRLPFNNFMTMYMKLGQYEKVLDIAEEIKRRNMSFDVYSYKLLMQSYCSLNDIDGVERVIGEMEMDLCS